MDFHNESGIFNLTLKVERIMFGLEAMIQEEVI